MTEAVTYVSSAPSIDRVLAAVGSAGFSAGEFHLVTRTVLDTFDGRLHHAGIRLELHEGPRRTLVAQGGGPAPARAEVDRLPKVAGDLPAGPLRSRLGPILDVRALLPKLTLTVRTASAVRRNETGKAVASVDLHDQIAVAGHERFPIAWAVEVRPFEGYPKATRATRDLLGNLGLTLRTGDLVALAIAEAQIDLSGFDDSPTVPLDASEPAVDGFARALAKLANTVAANRQGTVDDVDPEFLHDLRVAVRRARSVLSHGKGVLPPDARDHLGADFRKVQALTGPVRDLDVYLMEWGTYIEPLQDHAGELVPVLEHIRRERSSEFANMAERLRSTEFDVLMAQWRSWLERLDTRADVPDAGLRPLGSVVGKRLSKAQDRLVTRGRSIGPASPGEELHELRKDAKRLRYLLECFGDVFPTKPRKQFVQALKALQDNLGQHQDAEVHSVFLATMAVRRDGMEPLDPVSLVAVGRLIELFEHRRQAARAEFAERFATYDSKETAGRLRSMVDAVSGG